MLSLLRCHGYEITRMNYAPITRLRLYFNAVLSRVFFFVISIIRVSTTTEQSTIFRPTATQTAVIPDQVDQNVTTLGSGD